MESYIMNSLKTLSILAVAIGVTGCQAELKTPEKPLRPVNVVQLEHKENYRNFRLSGVIQSQKQADLSFRVAGKVENIFVNEGQFVRKGQILASLDSHDFEVQVSELQARLDEAVASKELAGLELSRIRNASKDGAIASIKLDRAETMYSRAIANVKLVTQALQKAEDSLRYTNLKAPFDGVVAQIAIDSFEQTSPQFSVLTLHQPDLLEAVTDVPEGAINEIALGMPAQINWHGHDNSLSATVTDIASVPHQLKRTYEVTFGVKNPNNEPLFSGKPVYVDLNIVDEEGKFCVPTQALVQQSVNSFVFKVEGNTVQKLPVEITNQKQSVVCIDGKLKRGDYIVTSGSAFVEDGQQIGFVQEVK